LQTEPFFFGPGAATFAAATFWATVVCVIPLLKTWNFVAFAVDYVTGVDVLRQLIVWVGVPAINVVVFTEMYFSYRPPFGFPANQPLLLWDFFFYAAFSGMSASLGVLAVLGRVATTGLQYKEQFEARLQRATLIMRSMHQMIRAQRLDELHELLKELLQQHMGVHAYVIFERQADGRTFAPTRTNGCEFDLVKEWRFASGDPGLPGQCAMFNSVVDRERYEAGLDGHAVDEGPVPLEACVPAEVDGTVTTVIGILRFARGRFDDDLRAFCSTLAVVLGAGLASIETLRRKDRELSDAHEGRMAAEAKAEFLKTAFSKTVAPSVVEQILHAPEKFKTGGERRILTVFYSDIRSFTSLSERVSADDMVTLLNEYFEAMARLVFRYEGTIDKWIGDAVMAFFGAPNDQPDHARRAIQMSIDMMQTLQTLNERWHAEGRFVRMGVPDYPGLRIGIGLHSGEANVGFLGAKSSRVDYTVIGDTVNTAARLVSKAEAGHIVFSRATVELAGMGFRVEACEPMQLKGKSEFVETYRVLY